jgi:hypothetical protein
MLKDTFANKTTKDNYRFTRALVLATRSGGTRDSLAGDPVKTARGMCAGGLCSVIWKPIKASYYISQFKG